MFKLDTFLNIFKDVPLSEIIKGVIIGIITTVILSALGLLLRCLWRILFKNSKDTAATPPRRALSAYEKNCGSQLNLPEVKIDMRFLDLSNRKELSISDMYEDLKKRKGDWLILGEAGIGKSTSLKELTLKYIEGEKKQEPEEVCLPIFLSLRDWLENKKL